MGRIAKNMKASNDRVMESMKLLLKTVSRIRDGFELEKLDALDSDSMKALEDLRDRSRTFYRLRLAAAHRELLQLRVRIRSDQPGREAAEDLLRQCLKAMSDLEAHLVSAPSRLIRARREFGDR